MTTALGRDRRAASRSGIWRVSTRAEFEALRRSRRRASAGSLAVTWLPPTAGRDEEPPRVAFAIGRGVGGAVVRNRIRRRLRAALRQLQTDRCLPAGSYLIGAGADLAAMPWLQLMEALAAVIAEAAQDRPAT